MVFVLYSQKEKLFMFVLCSLLISRDGKKIKQFFRVFAHNMTVFLKHMEDVQQSFRIEGGLENEYVDNFQ